MIAIRFKDIHNRLNYFSSKSFGYLKYGFCNTAQASCCKPAQESNVIGSKNKLSDKVEELKGTNINSTESFDKNQVEIPLSKQGKSFNLLWDS